MDGRAWAAAVACGVALACAGGGAPGDAAAEAGRDAAEVATDAVAGDPGAGDAAGDPGIADPGGADAAPEGADAPDATDAAPEGADAPDATDAPDASQDTCRFPAGAALANASVPDGYCAWTWASGLSGPRGFAGGGDGDLLVVERGAARVTALFDADGDGVSSAGERVVLAAAPGLNHGIAVRGGFLYASSPDTVYRWAYAAGDRRDLGAPQTVVRGLPTGGHSTRTLAFDAGGALYVSVGSGSNVDPDASRAEILRFDVSSVPPGGLDAASGERFAIGLRNEVGLAFDAAGRLWGVENGRDELSRADLGGDIHQGNPGEELNRFDTPGRFYGYPYCFSEYDLPAGVGLGPGTQWADPAFLDDGTHTDAWCRDTANVVPPRLVMPAHDAPLGVWFYRGAAFPADATGDAFVAVHGSWDADPPTGYRVLRVVFGGGSEPVRFEPFLAYAGPGQTGSGWPHRPVDVRTGPGGILLVSSDASGVILAVGHHGP